MLMPALLPFGAVMLVLMLGVAAIFTSAIVRKPSGAHTLSTTPYMPNVNPWRVGSTVLIREDPARPELSWYATVLSTAGGMITVRDNSAPYAPVQLEKERVFHVDTRF